MNVAAKKLISQVKRTHIMDHIIPFVRNVTRNYTHITLRQSGVWTHMLHKRMLEIDTFTALQPESDVYDGFTKAIIIGISC